MLCYNNNIQTSSIFNRRWCSASNTWTCLDSHGKRVSILFSTSKRNVKTIEPKVKNIIVFGSDADKNVYQPFEEMFPSAHHLLCDLYMKDNIRTKLTKTNLNTLQVDAVMKNIFGRKIGEVVEPGLVDSPNAEDYDKMADELFVKCSKNYVDSMKDFILYFKSKKSQLIKNCMTAEIRSLVGFRIFT